MATPLVSETINNYTILYFFFFFFFFCGYRKPSLCARNDTIQTRENMPSCVKIQNTNSNLISHSSCGEQLFLFITTLYCWKKHNTFFFFFFSFFCIIKLVFVLFLFLLIFFFSFPITYQRCDTKNETTLLLREIKKFLRFFCKKPNFFFFFFCTGTVL